MLLAIEINRGSLLPYFIKQRGKSEGVYIRVGATNRKASYENIMELERQRMNISYDQEVNRMIEFKSLDITPLANRFAEFNKSVDEVQPILRDHNGCVYRSKRI